MTFGKIIPPSNVTLTQHKRFVLLSMFTTIRTHIDYSNIVI